MVQRQAAAAVAERSAVPHQLELEWINRNAELLAQYAGEWIAIEGEQIVGHGPDLGQVLTAARESGHPQPLVFEAWSPDEGEWLP